MILATFLVGSALLWVSIFGYLLVLAAIARRRRQSPVDSLADANCPPVAIVVPVLNEDQWIDAKLDDLRQVDYPRDRLRCVVVDGGSTDHTVDLLRQRIGRGEAVDLMILEAGCGKPYQITHALSQLEEPFVVVTDADSRLEPGCVRALVAMLVRDPGLGAVGASVRPASALVEERLHWWLLNYLWWLEGEVLSSAVFSGVCYGIRRSLLPAIPVDAAAEDAHVALVTGARGFRVKTCLGAHATELRVPQTPRQLVSFRRRRGSGYAAEVVRTVRAHRAPRAWRVAQLMRLWHFLVTPRLAAALVLSAAWLLYSDRWFYAVAVVAAFGAPPLAALFASSSLAQACPGRLRLGLAFSRFVGLTWLSLLVMHRQTLAPIPREPA